ncbi:hypothetical protein [Streptomyces pinistramenti]|uniref:hypothetical protein n=1 Tax=Streptomyces pinistramenti TaxID=2884812 RepID=UPI001D070E2C|nr:hypothetical protein [Streptomyces pinistramenti]MCB5905893.1 hypothetical protein [Streptomyces pinistramenti]
MEPEVTVGEFIDRLSRCDRDAVLRLAINPFYPMAHRLGDVLVGPDECGGPVVYIGESAEAEQFGPLPPEVAVALTWHEPVDAPPRMRRSARRSHTP